jgi:AcrR family transcriptional regulator
VRRDRGRTHGAQGAPRGGCAGARGRRLSTLAPRPRLTAEQRRAALLETACRVFSKGSYRGTTTATIAREAGVSEPILYRHFPSKRDLYLACVDEAWREVRTSWERVLDREPDCAAWLTSMGRVFTRLRELKVVLSNLWVQALSEASEDPEIRRYLRSHLREVHDFVADVVRRVQAEGHIAADKDPDAEAWIFIAVGLLGAVGRRIGGVLGDEEYARVVAARRASLRAT